MSLEPQLTNLELNKFEDDRSNIDESSIWREAISDVGDSRAESPGLSVGSPQGLRYEVYSDFGEKDCGEPSRSQHLVIDFTPDPEIDTDEQQIKCCQFWDFINSKDFIKHLCVDPIPSQKEQMPSPTLPTDKLTLGPSDVTIPPAVTIIESDSRDFVEEGLCVRLPGSHCTSLIDSYSNNDSSARAKKHSCSTLEACVCPDKCATCKHMKKRERVKAIQAKARAKELCRVFDDWDSKNPKSMEPPGPVPKRYLPPPSETKID